MHWLAKVGVHWALSVVPGGSACHYFIQRKLGTFPASEEWFDRRVANTLRHSRNLGEPNGTYLEFGVGRDLVQPLVLWSLGFRRQILLDLFPLARVELVNDAIARLDRRGYPTFDKIDHLSDLTRNGIEYCAPADARATTLPAGSIKHIASTDVLEHVPAADLPALLAECRRVLAPDGTASMQVDYRDHYYYADPRLGPFNFLRYGNSTWRLFNPPNHYQNRLRHQDFVRLFATANLAQDEPMLTPLDGALAEAVFAIRPQ